MLNNKKSFKMPKKQETLRYSPICFVSKCIKSCSFICCTIVEKKCKYLSNKIFVSSCSIVCAAASPPLVKLVKNLVSKKVRNCFNSQTNC